MGKVVLAGVYVECVLMEGCDEGSAVPWAVLCIVCNAAHCADPVHGGMLRVFECIAVQGRCCTSGKGCVKQATVIVLCLGYNTHICF